MRSFLFIVGTILLSSCSNDEIKFSEIEDRLKQHAPDSAFQYFPAVGTTADQRGEGYYVRKWASEVLLNLREPVLYNYLGEGEFVRLIWLRTFDNSIVVRLSKFNDTVYADIKELKSKSSANDVPKILRDTATKLSLQKWWQILKTLQENNYWNETRLDTTIEAKDGIAWFLECKLRDKYHYIKRWDDGSFSSKDLNLYGSELVNIASDYVLMKSSK